MKKAFFILAVMIILIPGAILGIKTEQVEIGENGSYDAKVRIFRDEGGNLLFKDEAHTSPVKLLDLSLKMTEHKELSGLAADDHEQYINAVRHSSGHSAVFNDALAVSPDPGGHTQLGGHLQDSDIHLSKNESEMILASWKFDSEQEFRDNIRLSRHGVAGKADLLFEDGEDDARIRWDDGYDHFEFNRKIKATDAETDSLVSNTIIRAPGTLDGSYSKSEPTGKIENFASIEGISAGNLLDKGADEDISGKWDFLNDVYIDGDLVMSGLLDPQGGVKGLGKGNAITVAKTGGDFASIQDAVNAAQDGDVILIFPGVYEETLTISTANISLVGVLPNGSTITEGTNTGVVITKATTGVGDDLYIIKITATTGATVLANLKVINLANQGVGSAQGGLNISTSNEIYVKNCSFYGEQDAVFVNSCTKAVFRNCYINGSMDVLSIADDCEFYNCFIYNKGTGGSDSCVWVGKVGNVAFTGKFIGCKFDGGAVRTSAGVGLWAHDNTTLYFMNCAIMPNVQANCWYSGGNTGTIYLSGTNGTGWPTGTTTLTQDDLTLSDALDVGGDTFLRCDTNFYGYIDGDKDIRCMWDMTANSNEGGFLFADSGGNFNTNLICGGANLLKTDDSFSAQSFQSNSTVWQDYPAVTAAHGNVAAYDVQDGGPTPYLATGWMVNAVNAPLYVQTGNDGPCVYFPIPYLAGSILTRARVKWQASGTGDGVKLRLVKRDESGATTGWTVVGAQQIYTDAGSPYDVIVSTYDFSDETMASNTAYAIEVESEVAASGAKLFSVGIESSKRIY